MGYIETKCPQCGMTAQIDTEGIRILDMTTEKVYFEAFYVRCDYCKCFFDCNLRYDRVRSEDVTNILQEGSE